MHAAMMSVRFAEPAATTITSAHWHRPESPPPLPPPPPPIRLPTPPPPPPSPSSHSQRSESKALSSFSKHSHAAPISAHGSHDGQTAESLHNSQQLHSSSSSQRPNDGSNFGQVCGMYGYASWGHFHTNLPATAHQRALMNGMPSGMRGCPCDIPKYHGGRYDSLRGRYACHCPAKIDRHVGGGSQPTTLVQPAPVKASPPPTIPASRAPSPSETVVSRALSQLSARPSQRLSRVPPHSEHPSRKSRQVTCVSSHLIMMKCVECGSVQKPEHDNVKKLPAFGNLPMCWRCAFAQVGNEVGRVWLGNY